MLDHNGTRLRQVLRALQTRIGGPRDATASTPAPTTSSSRARASDDSPLRVLVIEDNPADALLLGKCLSHGSVPMDVEHVIRLRDAVAACAGKHFDAIVLGLGLPDARGPEAVSELQAAVEGVPIVVVSGDPDEAVALGAMRRGAQDYLLKEGLDANLLGRSIQYAIERLRHGAALQHLAHFDDLTGLANRPLFFDRVAHALERARRDQTRLALLFLDLDDFKTINDSHGHAAGDRVLQLVARRIEGALRQSDTVAVIRDSSGADRHTAARLGGDEFAILLENVADTDSVVTIVERLHATLREPVSVGQRVFVPTTSIGVALYPDDGSTCEKLLACADTAMYRAKEFTHASDPRALAPSDALLRARS